MALEFLVLVFCIVSTVSCTTYSNENGGLTTFPTDIPSVTRIVKLSHNEITTVPLNIIENITILTELVMINNKLIEFPEFGTKSSTLKRLNLKQNQISKVEHDDLKDFIYLQQLFLGQNPLTHMPDVSHMTTLTSLNIENCLISVIERDYFPVNSVLKDLYLSGNPLKSFSFQDLELISQILERLQINFIPLVKDVQREDLKIFTKLKKLSMQGVLLTKLPDIHYQKKSIIYMWLPNNKFSSMDKSEMDILLTPPLSSKRKILLMDNLLETFPCIEDLKSTTLKLDLRGNPLKCDCRLRGVIQQVQNSSNSFPVIDGAPCNQPAAFIGIHWNSIKLEDLQCIGEVGSKTTFSIWTKDEKKTGTYLKVLMGHTVLGCMRKCYRDPFCWNFNYNDNTRLCELIGNSGCTYSPSPGTKNYEFTA